MAEIEEELRTYLLADATIAGLIGTRLYPDILPQSPTMPALAYSVAGGVSVHSTDGASNLAGPRFQVDCWGATKNQAINLYNAVRKRLNGKRTGNIQGAFLEGWRDLYDPQPQLYRRIADFMVWHTEAT